MPKPIPIYYRKYIFYRFEMSNTEKINTDHKTGLIYHTFIAGSRNISVSVETYGTTSVLIHHLGRDSTLFN
jgi:hypothetical protein